MLAFKPREMKLESAISHKGPIVPHPCSRRWGDLWRGLCMGNPKNQDGGHVMTGTDVTPVEKGWGFDSIVLAAPSTFWSHILQAVQLFSLPQKQFRTRLEAVPLKATLAQMQDDWKLPEFHWSPSHRHSIPLLPAHGTGWPWKRGPKHWLHPKQHKETISLGWGFPTTILSPGPSHPPTCHLSRKEKNPYPTWQNCLSVWDVTHNYELKKSPGLREGEGNTVPSSLCQVSWSSLCNTGSSPFTVPSSYPGALTTTPKELCQNISSRSLSPQKKRLLVCLPF